MKEPYELYAQRLPAHQKEGAWPRLEYNARRTGRTWRMMQAAMAEAEAGGIVVIIVRRITHGRSLEHEYMVKNALHREGSVHSVPRGTIVFLVPDLTSIDYATMRPYAVDERYKVLWDHIVIEERYRRLLTELHRFDGELPEDAFETEEERLLRLHIQQLCDAAANGRKDST